MGGFGWQELLIILAIVLIIFGGARVAGVGTSLGKAISGFRKAIKEEDEEGKAKKDEVDKVDLPEEQK
jgi:sec-independent protein translocase protein TatA